MHDGMLYDPIQGQGQGHETFKVGTCESEIFVRIESRIELAATIRIRIESRIESGCSRLGVHSFIQLK